MTEEEIKILKDNVLRINCTLEVIKKEVVALRQKVMEPHCQEYEVLAYLNNLIDREVEQKNSGQSFH